MLTITVTHESNPTLHKIIANLNVEWLAACMRSEDAVRYPHFIDFARKQDSARFSNIIDMRGKFYAPAAPVKDEIGGCWGLKFDLTFETEEQAIMFLLANN